MYSLTQRAEHGRGAPQGGTVRQILGIARAFRQRCPYVKCWTEAGPRLWVRQILELCTSPPLSLPLFSM